MRDFNHSLNNFSQIIKSFFSVFNLLFHQSFHFEYFCLINLRRPYVIRLIIDKSLINLYKPLLDQVKCFIILTKEISARVLHIRYRSLSPRMMLVKHCLNILDWLVKFLGEDVWGFWDDLLEGVCVSVVFCLDEVSHFVDVLAKLGEGGL